MVAITVYHDQAQAVTDIPQLEENDREDLTRWGLAVKAEIDTKLDAYTTVPYTDSGDLPSQVKYAATIGVEAEYYLRENQLDRYKALRAQYLQKIEDFIQYLIERRSTSRGQLVSVSRAYQSSPLADE